MKLADTCIWIEALAATPTGERYYGLLQDTEKLVVPTLVQYELRRWCLRALRSGLSEEVADKAIAATRAAQVVVLDEATALYAAELAQTHGLATADALVYATALREQAVLVTCDAHFEGLPGVDYQPKLVH
jgi:predicted nucleic acid-binding protein